MYHPLLLNCSHFVERIDDRAKAELDMTDTHYYIPTLINRIITLVKKCIITLVFMIYNSKHPAHYTEDQEKFAEEVERGHITLPEFLLN